MIHTELSIIPPGDISRFAWSGLARFQNVAYVAKHIHALQDTPPRAKRNVNKQAAHIRYCIAQAEEYFASAKVISLATKPLLLYYGVMSLALSEILLKQDGDSSLDRARGQHAHHGLDLRLDGNPSSKEHLLDSGSMIRAAPSVRGGAERLGTFELWHRSAREAPISGTAESHFAQGTTQSRPAILGRAADVRLPVMPQSGLSLLDCLRSLSGMIPLLGQHGVSDSLVRARMRTTENELDGLTTHTLIVHPGREGSLDALRDRLMFDPNAVHQISCIEMNSGYIVNWSHPTAHGPIKWVLPAVSQSRVDDIYFHDDVQFLNEFGLYYVGLYMLGNYARYFPDQWMVDVESMSGLALAATAFLALAEERTPLLTLSELSRLWQLSE